MKPAPSVPADAAFAGPALVPLKGLRGSIARNMTAGWQAPRVAMGTEVDMTRCLSLQATLQQRVGTATRITVTPIVLRAVALALRAHPRMNALMREAGIELAANINLGLAVSLEEGLAVPVIRDADLKSIQELAQESRDSATAARAGKLTPKAYQGGTFTVTNLGGAGIDWFTPILNPPQVGILGLSRVIEKSVVRDQQIVSAPMTELSLVFDHRAVDGYPAALFLNHLKKLLESCEEL
jgi:pyruvate/2-oxoglutarate dehydrogenase complex dihydrolipoamide acyltransferase (E2) component